MATTSASSLKIATSDAMEGGRPHLHACASREPGRGDGGDAAELDDDKRLLSTV